MFKLHYSSPLLRERKHFLHYWPFVRGIHQWIPLVECSSCITAPHYFVSRNTFCIIGPLWGESTGGFTSQRSIMQNLFLCLDVIMMMLSNNPYFPCRLRVNTPAALFLSSLNLCWIKCWMPPWWTSSVKLASVSLTSWWSKNQPTRSYF